MWMSTPGDQLVDSSITNKEERTEGQSQSLNQAIDERPFSRCLLRGWWENSNEVHEVDVFSHQVVSVVPAYPVKVSPIRDS